MIPWGAVGLEAKKKKYKLVISAAGRKRTNTDKEKGQWTTSGKEGGLGGVFPGKQRRDVA